MCKVVFRLGGNETEIVFVLIGNNIGGCTICEGKSLRVSTCVGGGRYRYE